MVDQRRSEVRLRRSVASRLFLCSPFQWILTLAIALDVFLIIVVSRFASFGQIAPAIAPGAVIWVVWLLGVFAAASADGDGIRWRFYVGHRYGWAEVEQLRFGARRTAAGMATVGEAAIFVRIRGGREHRITPANGCHRDDMNEFGTGLIELARQHGVQFVVPDDDQWWAGVRHG